MSKYLKAFEKIKKHPNFQLIGDCILVEVMPDEEFKTKSGLVMSTGLDRNQINGISADKPTFVKVLYVGEGYFDDNSEDLNDEPKTIELESKPGDMLLVPATAIKKFSVFGKLVSYGDTQLGLIREQDVQARFKGEEGFDKFFTDINAAMDNNDDKG